MKNAFSSQPTSTNYCTLGIVDQIEFMLTAASGVAESVCDEIESRSRERHDVNNGVSHVRERNHAVI